MSWRDVLPCLAAVTVLLACGEPAARAPQAVSATADSEVGASPPRLSSVDLEALRGQTGWNTDVAPRPAVAIDETSPVWPMVTYLAAENALQTGDSEAAHEGFKALAEWGAGDPLGDAGGGSSLAAVALWRWSERLAAQPVPDRDELAEVFEITRPLLEARLSKRLFHFTFLDALPRLRERTYRNLALASARAGVGPAARDLFLDYLAVRSEPNLEPEERRLLDSLIASGATSRARVAELQARRLQELRSLEASLELWKELEVIGSPAERDLARLRTAQLSGRLFSTDRSGLIRDLDRVLAHAEDESVVQQALYARASVWSREGSGQRMDRFRRDLSDLITRFPQGPSTDDALFRLASHYQRRHEVEGGRANLETALDYFERLRSFSGPNDWLDSAHYQPAMTLYARAEGGDLEKALALLEDLNRVRPQGPLERNASFWQGRILDELKRSEEARGVYRELIERRPYDYQALRARMHLNLGPDAAGRLWPDATTRKEIAEQYRASEPPTRLRGSSIYHLRLEASLTTRIYPELVEWRHELRERFPDTRLQDIELAQLDEASAVAPLALLLSLRQDALAAAATLPTAENRLEIHAAVGLEANDLPLAMAISIGASGAGVRAEADPRFLHTAYPPAFVADFKDAARIEQIPPELLYALSRRESLFDPAALSTYAAMGLFQFIPSTFKALDERWKLLEKSGVPDRTRFLLDPANNARLGARWLSDELIFRQNCVLLKELERACNQENRSRADLALVTEDRWFGDALPTRQERVVLLALMEHSRGYRAVRGWLDRWQAQNRALDLEYMLETAGAAETRILVRGVVTDASIVAAIGLFSEPPQDSAAKLATDSD